MIFHRRKWYTLWSLEVLTWSPEVRKSGSPEVLGIVNNNYTEVLCATAKRCSLSLTKK